MRHTLLFSVFLLSFVLIAQAQSVPEDEILFQDGPPNARPGRCYVKLIDTDKSERWKGILCEWREWESLVVLRDELEPQLSNYGEHYINKRLQPLLQRGLPIEIKSYYASQASDETDACLAKARAREIGEYLIQEGLQRHQLKITIVPPTAKDTAWIQYRVINAIPKKWYLQ